jgi:hypothetical protein
VIEKRKMSIYINFVDEHSIRWTSSYRIIQCIHMYMQMWFLLNVWCLHRQCNHSRFYTKVLIDWFWFLVLTPLSAVFQLYHGDQFKWWRNLERTTYHGQATGKLYHLRLRVKCTLFCNLQSWARTHAVLVIGLYELLDPTT